MRTLHLIPALAVGLAILACGRSAETRSTAGAAGARPNIVLVLTDDQRWDALGCTGNPYLKTPNIDRIAREGALFENPLVVCSLCTPSRATILSGLYGHITGVGYNAAPQAGLDGHPTFPELLRDQGYETAFFGKWHLGNPGAKPFRGFDHWESFEHQGRYFDQPLNVDGVEQPTHGYLTDVLTEHAVAWIERAHTKPFLVVLSVKNPHFPYKPPERHVGSLENVVPALPPSAEDPIESLPLQMQRSRRAPGMAKFPGDEKVVALNYRQYLESILSVDESVARLFDVLERKGVLDATFLVFTSDNGFLWGDHGLVQKFRTYEPSLKVPLLVRYPPVVAPGTRVRDAVLNLDLAPTFLDLAGAPIPRAMQGRSLMPLLSRAKVEWRASTLHYSPLIQPSNEPEELAVRTAPWKYIRFRSMVIEEALYDLARDPDERTNLAGDPDSRKQLEIMRATMRELLGKYGAPETWWDPSKVPLQTQDD
jgi:N-acetylglucosamine-6-sulfatase